MLVRKHTKNLYYAQAVQQAAENVYGVRYNNQTILSPALSSLHAKSCETNSLRAGLDCFGLHVFNKIALRYCN